MDRDQSVAVTRRITRAVNRCACALIQSQRGAAIIETIIALPVLLVIILGAIQFGLIYQAKATLNHASLQAARAGAVSNASATSIRQGLARGLVPLYSPPSSLEGVATTLGEIDAALVTDARFRILNPTQEAFHDFAEDIDGQREIPNDRLHTRSTAIGTSSELNVQDANVLKVQVTYGYELNVPLVNWFISRLLSQVSRGADAFEQQLLRRTRLPIVASATVRMQSPARMSDLVVTRADLPEVARFDANSVPVDRHDSGQHDGEAEDVEPSQDGKRARSTLGDGFFGFGGGRTQPPQSPAQPSPESGPPAADNPPPAAGSGADAAAPTEEEEPLCTRSTSEPEDPDQDTGLLGAIWGELKSLAGTAIDFVKGFWQGVKGQLDDLIELVTDPLEVAKGLYQLAKEFIADPPGTAKMIGEAIGRDLQQLVHCGSFDRGRVIGSNVDPAFMLKLATKLAKFGRLAHALEETKRAFGCASFSAGTPVWTASGTTPIERIHVAEAVLSRDASGYADLSRKVAHRFARIAVGYVAVVTESDVLHVTSEHPFWVQGKGWTEVSNLQPGDALATVNGDELVLKTLAIDAPRQVFNFSVPDTESYFAGESGVWVHNATCIIPEIFRSPRSPSGYEIGASDGGSGAWVNRGRSDSAAMRYQQQITGGPREGSKIREYRVGPESGPGYDFDGFDAERGVLIDAKRWTDNCPIADCKKAFVQEFGANSLITDALKQIDAVKRSSIPNTPIEWHVPDRTIAEKISEILTSGIENAADRNRIKIVFTPDLTN